MTENEKKDNNIVNEVKFAFEFYSLFRSLELGKILPATK